jgi:hypothetical protein
VAVPCGCPTDAIVPMTATDARRIGVRAADAAFQWIQHVNPKWRAASASVEVLAVYAVGETSKGQFGDVFALSVPRYCGKAVAKDSYVVEMGNPTEDDSGREADVVVAHFASGWQVWGSFHP